MNSEIQCTKCGDLCVIDGDAPRYFAWCYTCQDYAEGFDATEYAADKFAEEIDAVEQLVENR